MKVADFDFSLPEELIAKKPAEKRDGSRFLVLHKDGKIENRRFHNLPEYLNEGDMLLLNNTMVFPARLAGVKSTGGRVEFLLVKEIGPDTWEILSKKKWSGKLSISEDFSAEIIKGGIAHFVYSGDFMENLWRYGDMPLPPYIKRKPEPMDKEWYQTVYAEKQGSIAAPTAGLHFTRNLIGKIKAKGVHVRYLTLHVGTGTFKPIRAENIEEHLMLPEYFEIEADIIEEIKKVKASNKRIVSVGTTTTRAIEGYMSGQWSEIDNKGSRGQGAKGSSAGTSFLLEPSNPQTLEPSKSIRGYTNIFIYPGYEFKAINSLITNFHLPCSTPLMLTSALCGLKKLKEAYNVAVTHKYRFFSYGDAMLIL